MAGPVAIRLISHGSARGPSTTSNRKGVSNAAGTVIDLEPNNADISHFTANGWSKVGAVGTTAQRPTTLNAGEPYVDTTLSKIVIYDGVGFRDPISGATV